MQAAPDMMNDRARAGPAPGRSASPTAAVPTSTKMPVPMIAPMPNAVRSKTVSVRLSLWGWVSLSVRICSMDLLRNARCTRQAFAAGRRAARRESRAAATSASKSARWGLWRWERYSGGHCTPMKNRRLRAFRPSGAPAGLRDEGDLRIGTRLAHDPEGKAFALAVPAGIDVGPAAGQHQSVQTVQDGAAEGWLGNDGKDDRNAAGRLDGRHVAVPDEDRGLALAPALAGPRVEIRRDPDDRFPHGAGDGSASSLARVGGSRRRDARKAEVLFPAEVIGGDHVVALDRRVPDRVRGPHV